MIRKKESTANTIVLTFFSNLNSSFSSVNVQRKSIPIVHIIEVTYTSNPFHDGSNDFLYVKKYNETGIRASPNSCLTLDDFL